MKWKKSKLEQTLFCFLWFFSCLPYEGGIIARLKFYSEQVWLFPSFSTYSKLFSSKYFHSVISICLKSIFHVLNKAETFHGCENCKLLRRKSQFNSQMLVNSSDEAELSNGSCGGRSCPNYWTSLSSNQGEINGPSPTDHSIRQLSGKFRLEKWSKGS